MEAIDELSLYDLDNTTVGSLRAAGELARPRLLEGGY